MNRLAIRMLGVTLGVAGMLLLWFDLGWVAMLGVFPCLFGHNLEWHAR